MYVADIPKSNPLGFNSYDLFWRLIGAHKEKMTRVEFTGSNDKVRALEGRELPFADLARVAGWIPPPSQSRM